MTTPATIFASAAADVTLDRVRQVVDQQLPEGLTLEYKETYANSVVKSVAAMGNSYGGIILVGVRDGAGSDRIVGVDEGEIVKIVNACHDSLEPPWEPEVIPVPLDDGSDRFVLVVRIDPAKVPRPLLLSGAAPVRLQGRNALANRDQLAFLFSESASVSTLTRQVLNPPILPTTVDGSPDADLILRSGLWVPLGEAACWRPLSEVGIEHLSGALNASPLGVELQRWAGNLGISGLNLFRRRGFNRARRARLTWEAVTSEPQRFPVESIAELVVPESYGASATMLSLTVDVVLRIRSIIAPEGLINGMPWRLSVPDLYSLAAGLLAGLTDPNVVTALADVAGIDPVLVGQPVSAYLITGPPVDELLYLQELRAVAGAGGSHGANLLADPTIDLGSPEGRRAQLSTWMQQVALDAGLQGMERLLGMLIEGGNLP
jgi:hypothetical protein